jgi:uncharacterized protein
VRGDLRRQSVMELTQKTITFVLTEECNFACRYCYLHGKNARSRMPLEVAHRAVDYLLGHRDLFPEEAAIWDFMGGEPLLEVELIEEIITHIRRRSYELDHPWFAHSSFSITTNGSLYGTERVQRFLARHAGLVEVGLTLDGPEHVQDRERVFPDGSGTYRVVAANVPLWLAQNPKAATKVTIAHDTIPFVAESILHLFDLGIPIVHANVVFEDVWEPGDERVFEEQLDMLGETIVERGLYPAHECSLFSRNIGRPLDPREDTNWCGPGKMIAIDAQGRFYPCNRFMRVSLRKREPRTIGSLETGLDRNRLRPFLALARSAQSPEACMECEVASGCAWCQGFNYDEAATPTIYERATFICEMHKARVRANRRFIERQGAHVPPSRPAGGGRR